MKRDIGFVCIGQGGGNIGDLLAQRGFKTFAINTSKEDIEVLKSIQNVFHIPDGKGCSHDRDKAKALLAAHFEEISKQVDVAMNEQKIVYFIFTTGGGTGSGFSPWFIDIMLQDIWVKPDEDGDMVPTKSVGVITVFTDFEDTPQAKDNCFHCLKELYNIPGLRNIFIIDNSKNSNRGYLNKMFVDQFEQLLQIPEKHRSKDGCVDKAELEKCLTTPGISVIATMPTKVATGNNQKDALTKQMIEAVRSSIYVPVAVSSDKKALTYVLSSTMGPLDYEAIKLEFGNYLDRFFTYNSITNIMLLCGLPFPEEHINKLKRNILEESEKIKNNEEARKINIFSDSDTEDTLLSVARRIPSTVSSNKTGVNRKDQLLAKLKNKK